MRSRRSASSRAARGTSDPRPEIADAPVEWSEVVTPEDFLAHRRSLPYLADVTAQFDSPESAWGPDSAPADIGALDVGPLAAAIRKKGGRHTDIRLLVGDGESHRPVVAELANRLRCDVYVTPNGADLRFVREFGVVTGESWDAIAIDRATGEPVDWLVVRPDDVSAELPTWFGSTRGRLRQSNGLVSLPLPAGLALATKATFQDTAALAGRMRAGTTRLTTVAVNAELGRFEISRFDRSGALLGGVEFATLIAASIDVVHPDVQLALTWPTDRQACKSLDIELMRLADALNRTVWVPQPVGSAFVLPGCGEFAAVDEVGSPAAWHAYPSRLDADWVPHHETDPDGRLVPVGNIAVATFPGVPLVSVPRSQLERLRPWYESVAPCDGLFAIDLAVLSDGRLGVCREDGVPLAVGARQLRAQLREAGWSGQDLLLLTQPPAPYWEAAIEHVRHLVNALKVDVWLPDFGAKVWVRPDGALAAQGPDGADLAWHGLLYAPVEDVGGSIAEPPLPAALAARAVPGNGGEAPPAPAARSTPASEPAAVEQPEVQTPPVESAIVPYDSTAVPGPESAPAPALEPDAVVVAPVATAVVPHAVPWLPRSPVVNARPVDLYLHTSLAPEDVAGWGLPSADLFLLACQDPLRLADLKRAGTLLMVSAPAQAAIDLIEHAQHVPVNVRQRLAELGSSHLLPVAWLSGVRVTARYDLDGGGGIAPARPIDDGALAVRFEGADHGVPGLPNDVVVWPDHRRRPDAPTYLMLPDDPATVASRVLAHPGFLALSRRRPPKVDHGHRLLEVKVRNRSAIDVPATLDRLAGLPVVGRLHDFVGFDLLLAEREFSNAVVTRVWRAGHRNRPVVARREGETLSAALLIG